MPDGLFSLESDFDPHIYSSLSVQQMIENSGVRNGQQNGDQIDVSVRTWDW